MPTKTKNTIADTMKTASTNGKEITYTHHTLTSADLEKEYAFPVVPASLDPIPDGAILTGPKSDGSQSFRGNLKQAGVPKETLIEWYKLMHLGRTLDDAAANYLKKAMGWSYHAPCAGHEGIQEAIGVSFRQKQDYLFPYYRDLMTCLAGGITVEEIILNGLSKETDIAGGGRHMSNHFAKMSIGIQNHSSLTNNQAQHTTGCARAIKYYEKDSVAIFSGGESGCSEGYFYEALNGATKEMVPAIFVIQNNKYGISVPVFDQTANGRVADNFRGFANLLITYCDGTDILDSYRAMQEAYQWVQSGKGAAMVHADCVRMRSHSNSDRDSLYRSPEELANAAKRDPVMQFREWLLREGVLDQKQIDEIHDQNKKEFYAAAEKAEAAPPADPATVTDFAEAPLTISRPGEYILEDSDSNITYYPYTIPRSKDEGLFFIDGINHTLKEEFRLNPNTFIWGEDMANKDKGGVFNVSKGMQQEFGPKRVFNAPIAEDFIVGTADGFCRVDQENIWVVVEGAEFADYFWPAMESFIELSHEYWRTKGQYLPNIVIRIASGGYIQGGLYHSQNLEGTFTTIPGVRIVVPSFADDAQGLLRSAMRTRGITVYLEPKALYYAQKAKAFSLRDNELIPFGKAKLRRAGDTISIITYGNTVHLSIAAAAALSAEGIECDVLDLRSLYPLDTEAILTTVTKTGRALVVHEDKVTGGFGGEIAALISDQAFTHLDAPVMRVGSLFQPVGFAKQLEDAILPNAEKIADAARKLAGW
jgi:2-oxoisovalerate dehydrogenase E1 component